jgi:NADP-dependent 3-hydroxy acid dehydrogenase YdfG
MDLNQGPTDQTIGADQSAPAGLDVSMAAQLRGSAGIVTGGGRGIGEATALLLASLGARLVVGDLSSELATAVATRVAAAGGAAVGVAADVRRYEDAARLAESCVRKYSKIDFVVANAGIGEPSTMAEGDPSRWRDVIETNVLGVAYTVRAALPTMQAQRRGHVVLMASVSGRESYVGEPIYVASKWAVVGLGRALRKEVLRHGVRVTLMEPGLVDTPLARSTPLGREWLQTLDPLSAQDVARAVVYALCQPPHVAINEIVLRPLAQEV